MQVRDSRPPFAGLANLSAEALNALPTPCHLLDEAQLRREQKLLLDYARMAVTEENVDILARQALAARPRVAASTLADEYPGDFARIIGLHTYSQSPRRCYDIRLTGEWTQRAASGSKNLS